MSQGATHILPVILCGGAGMRLWPASRGSRPKPFTDLIGTRSLFQAAVQRVAAPELFLRPIVIAGSDARVAVADQLERIGAGADVILEPVPRDTAAAVAVAACHAARAGPGIAVLVMPADHVIDDAAAFAEACREALEPARQGYIMTLGIRPRWAATGYGYIRPGRPIARTGAFRVECFVEKPSPAIAQRYVEQGFLWNSGALLFRADVMVGELQRFGPEVLSAARQALARAVMDRGVIRLDGRALERAPATSIDYAVMERTARAGVLPVAFSWSDIGSWGALWDVSPHDAAGNVVRGNVAVMEARNSLVHSDGILTAVVGVDDLVVVAEPDAVLVAARDRSERVKDLVASLRARRRQETGGPVRTRRPWGWLHRVAQGPGFQVRRIGVKPGRCVSLRPDPHGTGHWVVVTGEAAVTVNGETALVQEGESIRIPAGARHRLANPGPVPLEAVEVRVSLEAGER